ncbi:PilZ domain-containing protein [Metalysinibacillus jejuensis]|uniref:PilZ domain-containing protein n=1 Tax=Metalysinibacillus jejuensis TaxID=914327 RepID=UPI000D3828F1|nr:PilZ domain-containing protein [Metalysinibacillus jejuensis]
MVYRRNEGFRYAFCDDVAIKGTIKSENTTLHGKTWEGLILDISPQGMKVQTNLQLTSSERQQVQLEVNFCLDKDTIQAFSEVRWGRELGSQSLYGLYMHNQPAVEGQIVEELKARRRKEVLKGE